MQQGNVIDRLENISSKFDGEVEGTLPETLSVAEQVHLENWATIAAAVRNEMSEKTDFDFASKVMDRIAQEADPVIDQSSVTVEKRNLGFFSLRKLLLLLTETVVAASVCMITIFGYQTWNADDNLSIGDAVSTMGTVSGVNLASYQNRSNDHSISLDVSGNQNQHRLSPNEQ